LASTGGTAGAWGAGTSGNPRGNSAARAARSFAAIMEAELARLVEDPEPPDPLTETYKDRLVRVFVQQAARGNLAAFIELMNRTEGKVPDRLQATHQVTSVVTVWDDDEAPTKYLPNTNATDARDLLPPDAIDAAAADEASDDRG
jgi:hypothetical protein